MIIFIYLILFVKFLISSHADDGIYEEYRIDTPTEVHSVAVHHYLDVRSKDPENFNLSDESPVMIAARTYAENRLIIPPEDSISLRVWILLVDFFNRKLISYLLHLFRKRSILR